MRIIKTLAELTEIILVTSEYKLTIYPRESQQ